MKILMIQGSPKKQGKTAKAISKLEEKLEKAKHETTVIHIQDLEIKGCKGCMGCISKPHYKGCVLSDDAHKVFDLMEAADAIVYASPVYGWDFSGQMKLLFDRHLCLVKGYHTPNHQTFFEDKKVAFLFTCMGPEGKPNTDILEMMTSRLIDYLKVDDIGMYVVPGSMKDDFDIRLDKITQQLCKNMTV